jgi:hypothetical protein
MSGVISSANAGITAFTGETESIALSSFLDTTLFQFLLSKTIFASSAYRGKSF